jgi:hypothetical protein
MQVAGWGSWIGAVLSPREGNNASFRNDGKRWEEAPNVGRRFVGRSDITSAALPHKRLPRCLRLPSRSTRVAPRRVPHPLAPGAQWGTSMR